MACWLLIKPYFIATNYDLIYLVSQTTNVIIYKVFQSLNIN